MHVTPLADKDIIIGKALDTPESPVKTCNAPRRSAS